MKKTDKIEREMQTQASKDAGENKKPSEETLQKIAPMLDQVKEILGEARVILKED